MKKYLPWLVLAAVLWQQNKILLSQNLVPNPSFEDTIQCPGQIGQLNYTTGWYKPTNGSSDYYNACCTNGTVGIPQNLAGWEFAKTGVAYAGIITYLKPGNSLREYIQVQLKDTLLAGAKYDVSFFVSLSDSSQYACNSIGAHLSDSAVSIAIGPLPYTPQISNTSPNLLTDKNGWTLVADTIIAIGGELFITIGNFNNDANSDTIFVGGPMNGYAYYYIDDVSVQLSHSAGINNKEEDELFNIYPNPSAGIFKVELLGAKSNTLSIEIFNIFGENIYSSESYSEKTVIDLRNKTNGIYFLRIKNDELITTRKLVIQK